jgi:hypothetical protein
MTVKITKPEINIREKINELDKPSGLAGEAMLRAETPQEQFNLISAGRKNLIINGENKISQRGNFTSATAVTASSYYIDRWKAYESGVTVTLTHKQNQSLPDGSVSHTQRYDVTVAGTGYAGAQQILEENLTAGRHYTISAWVKSNDPNMNLFANGGDERSFHSGGGGWEKLSVTWRISASETNSYGIINYTSAGNPMVVGHFVEFTQFQIELGKVATPFEHRLIPEELALCQRYYQAIPVKYESIIGQAWSTTSARFPIQLPVEMRASPSITIPPPGQTGYAMKPLTASLSWPGGSGNNAVTATSNRSFYITCTGYSGLVSGNASTLYAHDVSYIKCNAEL